MKQSASTPAQLDETCHRPVIIICTTLGQIVFIDECAGDLLGELLNSSGELSVSDVFSDPDERRLAGVFLRDGRSGTIDRRGALPVHAAGSVLRFEFHPVFEGDGRPAFSIVTVTPLDETGTSSSNRVERVKGIEPSS